MKINLDRLKELAEKATPGPWVLKNSSDGGKEVRADKHTIICDDVNYYPQPVEVYNQAYIAAASPDVVKELIEMLAFAHKLHAEVTEINVKTFDDQRARIRKLLGAIDKQECWCAAFNPFDSTQKCQKCLILGEVEG